MSKALVIKGANFVANKVETITLAQVVPCTGISITPTTISFDALGATQQIVPTLTPADTTEAVYYVSSNPDVVTVGDTGLMTCVGVGSATVTVTCGNQSATCDITATITVVADDTYYTAHGYKYSGSMELPTKNHVGFSANTGGRLFYSIDDVLGGYHVFNGASNTDKYAIPLPAGATKVTIAVPTNVSKYHAHFVLCDTTQKQTYIDGADGQSALGIYAFVHNNNTTPSVTFDISEYAADANGFICSIQFATPSTDADVSGKITLTFE